MCSGPEEISYDRLIKAGLRDHYADFVTWLIEEHPVEVSILDTHLVTTAERIADKLLEVHFKGRPGLLLHLEFQIQGDREMPKRMVQYAALMLDLLSQPEHRDKNFLSVVVYLDRKTFTEDPGFFIRELFPGMPFRYFYRVVKLWELDPEPILSMEAPGIWPFVPLMRGDPMDLLQKTKGKILHTPDTMVSQEGKQQLLSILGGLAWRVIKDWRFLQGLFAELRNMDDNKFLNALIEDHLQRKGARVARKGILQILERRFGETGQQIQSRLVAIEDLEALEKLVVEAAVAPNLEAFLSLLPPPEKP